MDGLLIMDNLYFQGIVQAANSREFAETGGGHNAQGVDFQRAWAVARMVELEQEGAKDFLFLFESVQDIAVLDSETEPTQVCLYQVKKKDRGEWSWNDLTGLMRPTRKAAESQDFKIIKDSPIGKLYSSVLLLKGLNSTGKFISNLACALPLEGGENAATSLACDLSRLEKSYLSLLGRGLATLHGVDTLPAMPALLHVEKVPIPPEAASVHLKGLVLAFLTERSLRHAGQAGALVDSLLAKIGPLGAKTKTCSTFGMLRKERGYSRSDFLAAIGALEQVPDQVAILDRFLVHLAKDDGVNFVEEQKIRISAADIFRKQLFGGLSSTEEAVASACDSWLFQNEAGNSIREYLEKARTEMSISALVSRWQFTAQFLLRLANKCEDQT